MQFRNDIISVARMPVAIIYEIDKDNFGYDDEIHIKSIETGEVGVYFNFCRSSSSVNLNF